MIGITGGAPLPRVWEVSVSIQGLDTLICVADLYSASALGVTALQMVWSNGKTIGSTIGSTVVGCGRLQQSITLWIL